MAERIPAALQQMLSDRLSFYEDIGIHLFYRDRAATSLAQSTAAERPSFQVHPEETPLPKTISGAPIRKTATTPASLPRKIDVLPVPSGPSLFESVDKIADDSLLKIRTDLGDCTRCKLHKGRHTIVFGDGNPKAQLVFVGEGPGHDEDVQGLPFVGRAGKLLTQMIEAMGLQMQVVPEYRLWTLNAVRIPDGVDDGRVRGRLLNECNIEVGGGLGVFAGKIWRVGLMGAGSTDNNVLLLLAALEKVLTAEGFRVKGSGVSAAVAVYTA